MLEMWILLHQIQECEMTLVWCHQCQVYFDTNSHVVIYAIPVNLLCLSSDESAQNDYNDVMVSAMASQITSFTIVYSTVYSGSVQRKHQSSASLAFVREIHQWPVTSLHKGPITRKMFSFGDVIMIDAESIIILIPYWSINTLRLWQNGRHSQTILSYAFFVND